MKLKNERFLVAGNKFPLMIILAGILFSLYLQFQIKDETFFSGDGSLKFLLAKQFSSGDFRFDINLPGAAWVYDLWKDGLYPLGNKEPFIYYRFNRYYSPFPFTFSLITAPFYALFGFKGLNIIPLISLWAIWFRFYVVCQLLNLKTAITTLALATLIFSSPLTIYGATYWEHTLAVALAFYGLTIILAPRSGELSKGEAIFSGILLGLSVWFRGEFLCLIGIMCLSVLASSKLNFTFDFALLLSGLIICLFVLSREEFLWFIGIGCLLAYALAKINFVFKNKLFFLSSMLLTLSLYWLINIIIYHHPLGIHALQVVEHLSLRSRFSDAFKYFKQMNYELFYYFPLLFFSVFYVLISLFNKKLKLTPKMNFLFLIYALFTFFVPLLLPSDGGRQWGPRFLLMIVPIISLLSILMLQISMRIKLIRTRYILSGIFALLFAIGLYINTQLGTSYLIKSYQRSHVLMFLQKSPDKIVAVTHEFVSQSLASILNKKIFFLTKKNEDLIKLATALNAQGHQNFIYICHPYHPCYSSKEGMDKLGFSIDGKKFNIEFSKMTEFDKPLLYEALIVNSSQTSDGS
jgi:4-amino-4-deoxy-L-arabinose transferase-like glycosyltransferase